MRVHGASRFGTWKCPDYDQNELASLLQTEFGERSWRVMSLKTHMNVYIHMLSLDVFYTRQLIELARLEMPIE
jgi:hypothetical protein